MTYEATDGQAEFSATQHPSGDCMTCSTYSPRLPRLCVAREMGLGTQLEKKRISRKKKFAKNELLKKRKCVSLFGSSHSFGVPCASVDHYPNATVTEYGSVSGEAKMMNEIFARGPIGCGVERPRPTIPI